MVLSTTDWTKETTTLNHLREKAREWDDSERDTRPPMTEFLKFAGLVPHTVVWKRKNSLPRTSLDRNAIPVGYLAEVAYEWDNDGYSTADEFIDAIEFEVAGTASNNLVSEVMEELGR